MVLLSLLWFQTYRDPSHSSGLLLEKCYLLAELEDGLVLTSEKQLILLLL